MFAKIRSQKIQTPLTCSAWHPSRAQLVTKAVVTSSLALPILTHPTGLAQGGRENHTIVDIVGSIVVALHVSRLLVIVFSADSFSNLVDR